MIEEILANNGLSAKEASIYLAVLKMGEATIGGVATMTHLKRPTVYAIIEDLIRRGLLSAQSRRGIKRVAALPPQVLIERFRNAAAQAESVLPALLEMAYSSPLKPRIRFYEGIDGIRSVIQEVNSVRKAEPGMIFTDYARMPKAIFDEIKKASPGRRETKNFLQIIVPPTARNLEVQADEHRWHYAEHRTAVFPLKTFPLELSLFGNTQVAFMSFQEGEYFGVVIDSEAIYLTLKNLFLMIWENAKPKA